MLEKVLDIPTDAEGVFVSRENRFLGIVDIGKPTRRDHVQVHIRDPGRLEEILFPGNKVLLQQVINPNRKTDWDLIAGTVKENWILVNSGYHRQIAEWILQQPRIPPFSKNVCSYKAEQSLGESRIDFLVKTGAGNIWMEVKGCTLAKQGRALFPDAPTARGRRHIKELIRARKKGDQAAVLILVFRPDADCFTPNEDTDPKFAQVFRKALDKNVQIFPYQFMYKRESLYLVDELPICAR